MTSAKLIIDFCNNILEQNAVRASRNEVPLDYDECQNKWEQKVRKGYNNNEYVLPMITWVTGT